MIIVHNEYEPKIDDSCFIAINATVCGNVTIGKNCRVMYGACIIAEDGKIVIGENCVILENAVLRSTKGHDLEIKNNVLIGPNAHVVGAKIDENVFIATGAAVFHGSHLGKNSEVRINGVVHTKSVLKENDTVPINWVAVGAPATIFPPNEHDKIWEIQKPLNFPLTVYGVDRNPNAESIMPDIMKEMVNRLRSHQKDKEIKRSI